MKKTIIKCAVGFMFVSAIISCQDDFLSTTPLSEIAESNVWSSAKLAEAAVLDLYQATWAGTLTREETTDALPTDATDVLSASSYYADNPPGLLEKSLLGLLVLG